MSISINSIENVYLEKVILLYVFLGTSFFDQEKIICKDPQLIIWSSKKLVSKDLIHSFQRTPKTSKPYRIELFLWRTQFSEYVQ